MAQNTQRLIIQVLHGMFLLLREMVSIMVTLMAYNMIVSGPQRKHLQDTLSRLNAPMSELLSSGFVDEQSLVLKDLILSQLDKKPDSEERDSP